jgi:cytochrome c553
MKKSVWILATAFFAVAVIATAAPQQDNQKPAPMPWAYAGDAPPNTPPTPGATPPAPDPTPRHTPTSPLTFTIAQVRTGEGDWHPEDHGPMPNVVAHGRPPDVGRCSQCHLHNGRGRMENGPVAGLPVEYFLQTMSDFKNGLRVSAEPRKGNAKRMASMAKAMTDDEIRAAADYYAAIPFPSEGWIKVVETNTVPKTKLESDALRIRLEGNETEPIGNRIVEVPDNTEATSELRDDHSPFTAYVPMGSLKKGEALVTTGGGGKTVQCALCHGDKLEGIGPVPPLAGRTPSYLARQLYDMEHGFRKGPWTGLMQKAVEKLTDEDILDICAYLTSRPAAPPLALAKKTQ